MIGEGRRLMECAPRGQSSGLITVFTLTAAWFARLRFPPGGFLSRFSPCEERESTLTDMYQKCWLVCVLSLKTFMANLEFLFIVVLAVLWQIIGME